LDKKILITKDGPYEVQGDIPLQISSTVIDEEGTSLKWQAGKNYPQDNQSYFLCRCGHSKNKPFCDGSHIKAKFNGQETATYQSDTKNTAYYKGPQIDLVDEKSLCASLRFCHRAATVWGAVEESDKPENKELAIEEACDCASGRLTILQKDGTPIDPKLNQEISLVEDTAAGCRGPLWVKGGIPIESVNGQIYKVRNRVTLCRCGESNNKPFCDGQHLESQNMQGFDS